MTGAWFNVVILVLYICSTIAFAISGKWALTLMNFGSVVFTAGLVLAAFTTN